MKQYIVRSSNLSEGPCLESMLNNPPEGYHVDSWQVIPPESNYNGARFVVYKLDDPKVETINNSNRKFKKGENE